MTSIDCTEVIIRNASQSSHLHRVKISLCFAWLHFVTGITTHQSMRWLDWSVIVKAWRQSPRYRLYLWINISQIFFIFFILSKSGEYGPVKNIDVHSTYILYSNRILFKHFSTIKPQTLRMFYVYTLSQKFSVIRISVLRYVIFPLK